MQVVLVYVVGPGATICYATAPTIPDNGLLVAATTPARVRQDEKTSPATGEKVLAPSHQKRRLLAALEEECRTISELVLRKQQILANKTFENARAAIPAGH